MKKMAEVIIIMILFCSITTVSFAQKEKEPSIKGEAAVILDTDSGAVLYEKNADERLYPASLTKIATAIYALEKGNLDDMVTVSRNAARTEGTRVYLNEGEKVPLKKLLQGMLINSGNDAAVAVAEHLDGNVEQFSSNLNKYLVNQIGVRNTHFSNPNGLFNANHYTTAMDMAKITAYAQKNSIFSGIFGTKELAWDGQSWRTTIFTHHKMLKGEISYPWVTGGKTGFIDESKQTLATAADNGRMRLTVIELKADKKKDIYKDTIRLLNYGFAHFHREAVRKGQVFFEGKKEYSAAGDAMITVPEKSAVKKINELGTLIIQDKKGKILQSVPLVPIHAHPLKKAEAPKPGREKLHLNGLYGAAALLIVWMFIGFKKFIF